MIVALALLAFHCMLFSGVVIFLLVAMIREPYLKRELSLPTFLALAAACASGVAWYLLQR